MQDDNDTRTEQLSLRRGNEGPTSRSGEKRGVSSDSSETTSLTPFVDPSSLLKNSRFVSGHPFSDAACAAESVPGLSRCGTPTDVQVSL